MSSEYQLHICYISKADGLLILCPKNYTQISSLPQIALPHLFFTFMIKWFITLFFLHNQLILTKSTKKLSYTFY